MNIKLMIATFLMGWLCDKNTRTRWEVITMVGLAYFIGYAVGK